MLSSHNEPTELHTYLVNLYTVHIYTQKYLSSFQVFTGTAVQDQGRICKMCFLRKLHVYIYTP